MTISASARIAGVIGWPIAHSLSPLLHGFWLQTHGIDGALVPLAVKREDFTYAVDGLRRSGFRGASVTVPHKQAAFALAHDCDRAACAAGAANLLVFHADGRTEARNTDAAGLAASLAERLGRDALKGARVVLLGAGGAARAAILALDMLGASEIRLLNRSMDRAENLATALADKVSARVVAGGLDAWPEAAADARLLVNTTAAGMAGSAPLALDLDALPASAAVSDIVYNPLETDLLRRARAAGRVTIDGLGMLMHQAVPAFEAFFGVVPKVTPELRRVLEAALAPRPNE